ncbi:hypothetical protein MNBD_GAMMA05-83 [hydrothermal vent metagenome]|uniref:Uncharacterized protein n=1 Tax=hydrothermal vent metagenome TaxID=652676 RepID=A0A3B0WMG9_9ZZZZ
MRTVLTCFLFLLSTHVFAEGPEVINVGGREVLLKQNGQWEYRSTDQFANTTDGRRVRIKKDGSWSYIGNASLKSNVQVRTSNLDIKLNKVVIETYKQKTQKSSRIKTQTVFHLKLNNSAQSKTTVNIRDSDVSQIEVKDNNGKVYPVLSIKADHSKLEPDRKTTLIVRAEKSPSIFDSVNLMQITLKAGLFGLQESITLSQRTIDFNEKNVDGFD